MNEICIKEKLELIFEFFYNTNSDFKKFVDEHIDVNTKNN